MQSRSWNRENKTLKCLCLSYQTMLLCHRYCKLGINKSFNFFMNSSERVCLLLIQSQSRPSPPKKKRSPRLIVPLGSPRPLLSSSEETKSVESIISKHYYLPCLLSTLNLPQIYPAKNEKKHISQKLCIGPIWTNS